MTARLRIRSIALPLATLGVLLAQLINPGPTWKGLLAAFGVLWLASYLWARALRRNIRLERLMRFGWAQVGDRLEEQLVLQNDSSLPATWVEIADGSTLPGYYIQRATGVDGNSQNAWRTSGVCQRRGVYTLGHTRLLTGDPLGIYEVELDWPDAVTLTVLPPIIPLPFLDIVAAGWQRDGKPRPHALEQTVNAESVRQYAPGDSLRLIHWPTTVRHNEPYVRVLEGTPSGERWIVLDFDRQVQAGESPDQSTAELGVILAASLADRGLVMRQPTGLIAGSQPPAWIRPSSGEGQRWDILRQLAVIEPGDTDLASLLETANPALGQQSKLVVITPSTESDWVQALARLGQRGIRATAILIEPSTFGDPRTIEPTARLLGEAGISSYIVGRDVLERPEARPGPSGQWEWQVLATGKALPTRRPVDLTWKHLQ